MLTVPEWLSIFPVQVKLPCNYLCQSFLRTVKILPFTFIEKGDSGTIKYKTVPLKSGPSQLSSPETVISKLQVDLHQYFICRYRQLQDTILGSRVQHWILLSSEPDVHLRLQTKEVQSPNLACRRLEVYRPVARRALTRDDTNRRKKTCPHWKSNPRTPCSCDITRYTRIQRGTVWYWWTVSAVCV
jgi:hypothetical protein